MNTCLHLSRVGQEWGQQLWPVNPGGCSNMSSGWIVLFWQVAIATLRSQRCPNAQDLYLLSGVCSKNLPSIVTYCIPSLHSALSLLNKPVYSTCRLCRPSCWGLQVYVRVVPSSPTLTKYSGVMNVLLGLLSMATGKKLESASGQLVYWSDLLAY